MAVPLPFGRGILANFKTLERALREKAVYRIALVVEQLQDGGQLRQNQQFHVPPRDIRQLKDAALLLNSGETDHQHSQPGTIQKIDMLQIENQIAFAFTHQSGDSLAQRSGFSAGRQPSPEIQNLNAFDFAVCDVHADASVSAISYFPKCGI
jgi:hypothetical protein